MPERMLVLRRNGKVVGAFRLDDVIGVSAGRTTPAMSVQVSFRHADPVLVSVDPGHISYYIELFVKMCEGR